MAAPKYPRKPCTGCQQQKAVCPGGLCRKCYAAERTPMPAADQLPVVDLPLDSIVIDGDTQARVEVEDASINSYGEAIEAGDVLPPVDVFGPDGDGRYWMGDGFHRYLAHEQKGRATIQSRTHPGGKREALSYAIGANATHGLPRTTADKIRAVELILADPEWSKLSTEQVARMARVHWHTANKVREMWEANGTPATRTGADGIAHPARLAEPPPVAALAETPDAVADEIIEQPAEQTPDESETLKPRAREAEAEATSSPPIKVPGRVMTDAWGVPVPDHLLPVWESAEKLRAMVKAVQKAKVDFASLRGQKGTEKFSAASQNTLAAHIDNAINLIRAGTPFVVCPDCDGDCCDGRTNSTCEARGWLCRERYERCTTQQKRKAERFKNTTAG